VRAFHGLDLSSFFFFRGSEISGICFLQVVRDGGATFAVVHEYINDNLEAGQVLTLLVEAFEYASA